MNVLTVSQIARYLRESLESDPLLADLWVSGEVSNLFQSTAGHHHFTLKDAQSQLRCVMFRPAWGGSLLRHGAAVIVHGHVSLYETRGELQLYVDLVQPAGVGLLHLEFERLKAKLAEEGLFAPERKRPLPPFPQRIGLVTSPSGAVFHDIVNILSRRYPVAEVIFSPSPVQGDGAAEGIVIAMEALNRREDIDLIILARGGGSLEELWAFNEEKVARAIYGSRVPVVTGIGHETDFTIADFVADVRAPTPSAAAELCTPDQAELRARLLSWAERMGVAMGKELMLHRQGVETAARYLRVLLPDLDPLYERVEGTWGQAARALEGLVQLQEERVAGLARSLASLSPQGTLNRGYALVRKEPGEMVSRVSQVAPGDAISVRVSDGSFRGEVKG